MSKISVYEIVTNQIIEALEKGVVPWQAKHNALFIPPQNYSSGKPYRGINFFLLACFSDNPFWMTFKQLSAKGGTVKKGSKSRIVCFWKWIHKDKNGKNLASEKGAYKSIPCLRYYRVFSADDIEGIEFVYPEKPELKPNQKIKKAESIVADTGVRILRGNQPLYNPSRDFIKMPEIGQFESSEYYYKTLFHELTHWTGHSSRLDRLESTKFGSKKYSKEELVAEMGAAFLSSRCQIKVDIEHSASYLNSWIGVLKGDSKMILSAAGKAQKAVDFILEKSGVPA